MDRKYTACGGCGADHPDQRCIGCRHDFGNGAWNGEVGAPTKEADNGAHDVVSEHQS